MTVIALADLVKVYATNTGTGPFVLGSAVASFRGREALTDGATYGYSVQQGAKYEIGTGVFTASDNMLSRAVLHSSDGGGPISLAPSAVINFPALRESLLAASDAAGVAAAAADAANAAATTATSAAVTATAQADIATDQAAVAVTAAADALSAVALVGGTSHVFGTKALADAGIGAVANGDFIQVLADETVGGSWTVYEKVTGAYVFRATNASGGITISAGSADANKLTKLDAEGRIDHTLLAPDGYQRQDRIVLSDAAATGNLGSFSGTFLDSRLIVHGGPAVLDTQSCGVAAVVWGDHSKGATDYVGKSRGADQDMFAPCLTGDTVYRKFIQASGVGASFGHVGVEGWVIDATPTNSGEVAGRFYIQTDTGLHISEASVERPTYYGLKIAFALNRKQQAYFPGIISAPPAAGTDFGGWIHIGACGENVGEANICFNLTDATLATVAAEGTLEAVGDKLYYSGAANKRGQILVGQVKEAGDSGAIAAGAGAGTGPTISVVWGNGWARVTLTTGVSPTAGGVLFTLTYPHSFTTHSAATLQAGNVNAASFASKCFTTPGTTNVVVTLGAGISPAASTTYIIDVEFRGE